MATKFALFCCCAILLLGEVLPFGYAMKCVDPEDEGICNRMCQSRGARYGRCEYSECNCYGRRRMGSFESDDDGFMTRQGLYGLSRVTAQKPATQHRKPLVCSSSLLKASDKSSSSTYMACRTWCEEAQFEMYMSLDNLCCCRKKD